MSTSKSSCQENKKFFLLQMQQKKKDLSKHFLMMQLSLHHKALMKHLCPLCKAHLCIDACNAKENHSILIQNGSIPSQNLLNLSTFAQKLLKNISQFIFHGKENNSEK